MPIHFRRTVSAGFVSLGIAAMLAMSRPDPGPGLYAGAGLSVAGLLLLAGLRGLPREQTVSRPFLRLKNGVEQQFPVFLIFLQNYFIALTLLPLWFATTELGFPATPLLHIQLMALLILAPVRRVLQGSQPTDASPRHELMIELTRYIHISLIALFVGTLITRLILPPGERLSAGLPPGLVLLWVPCVLVIIGCVVLFIDHILRKMPPTQAPEEKDTLE